MTDALTQSLMRKLQEDLKMRQVEFKNDHVIRTAIQMAIQEIDNRLRQQDD